MDALLQQFRQQLRTQLNAKPQLYMRGTIILTITIALILISACSNQTQVATNEHAPLIRVLLLQSTDGVMITGNGETLVQVAGESQPHRLRLPAETPIMLTRGRDGWHIGNIVLGGPTGGGGTIVMSPAHDGDIAFVGKSYRGRFRLVPVDGAPPSAGSPTLAAMGLVNASAGLKFDVINDVDVDSYLNSVITGEMPRTFGDQAYRAQAIVARTYAIYESKKTGIGRNFDVYADTRSQMYPGMAAETDRSRNAVHDTSGVVVAAGPPGQERIFKAYFSACCGGVGQSAADAFGDAPSRELSEQKVGSLCNISPKYNWPPVELTRTELTRRIRAWGAKRGRPEKDMAALTRIDIESYNQFSRPVRFMLTDASGRRYSLGGEETRAACNADATAGAPTLNSSYFNPINEPDSVRFSDGHGLGHGVGLCQWCAEARSEQGMRGEDIVVLSYPGSKLVHAY